MVSCTIDYPVAILQLWWTGQTKIDKMGKLNTASKKQGGMHKLLNIKNDATGDAVWTLECYVVSGPCAFHRTWQKCVPMTTAPISCFWTVSSLSWTMGWYFLEGAAVLSSQASSITQDIKLCFIMYEMIFYLLILWTDSAQYTWLWAYLIKNLIHS